MKRAMKPLFIFLRVAAVVGLCEAQFHFWRSLTGGRALDRLHRARRFHGLTTLSRR